MSIQALVTGGYGNGTFDGSIPAIVMRGYNEHLSQTGVFAATTTTALSATSSLRYNATFNSETTTSASFVGSVSGIFNGTFDSVTTSTASFVSSLRLNAQFASVSNTTLNAEGRINQYSSFVSVSTTDFTALATAAVNTFNSVSTTSFSASGYLVLYGLFNSVATTSLSVINSLGDEPEIPDKRIISESGSNRVIIAGSSSRSISSQGDRTINTQ